MGELKKAFESFRENVVHDPVSSLIHQAARDGMRPFCPRVTNLSVLPSFSDFDTVIRVDVPKIPCLTQEFRLNEDELKDVVYGNSFGYELADRVFKYYRYQRPRQEPEPNIVLGEN